LQICGLACQVIVIPSHLALVDHLLVKDMVIHPFPRFSREGTPRFSCEG
jgi:hypothetical protein